MSHEKEDGGVQSCARGDNDKDNDGGNDDSVEDVMVMVIMMVILRVMVVAMTTNKEAQNSTSHKKGDVEVGSCVQSGDE